MGVLVVTAALVVTDVDPVRLEGFIDSAGEAQVKYGSSSLADHEQTLNAVHEKLDSPNGTIRIKLVDFSYGGGTWKMTASHYDGGAVNWTRSTDHAYFDFVAMVEAVDVTVIATSIAAPSKPRPIFIKVLPEGSK